MFRDDSNLLYLTFLKPILREVNNVNLQFQSENVDLTKVYQELKLLMMSVAKRLIKPIFLRNEEYYPNALCLEDINKVSKALKNPLALLPVDAIDFGYAFSILAEKKTIDPKLLNVVKNNCANFLLCLCQELVKRLPDNVKCIQKLKYFNPILVFSAKPPTFSDLRLQLSSNVIINTYILFMIQHKYIYFFRR